MLAVMHQPCFLPWLGFFAKLAWADLYIVMDDSHFRKRYYHDRAQIIDMQGQKSWLSLPTGQHLGECLSRVPVPSRTAIDKIARTIEYSYAKADAFDYEWPKIRDLLDEAFLRDNLAEFNLTLIEGVWREILLRKPLQIERTSRMQLNGDATDRIIDACRASGVNTLVVGMGASLRHDIHDIDRLRIAGIRVLSQDFQGAQLSYAQKRRSREGFIANLSIVDSVLNIGGVATYNLCGNIKLEPKEVLR